MLRIHVTLVFVLTLLGYQPICLADKTGFLAGTIRFNANDLIIRTEVAANQKQRERGLMYRQTLDSDQSMLFVFEEQATISVWMKHTLIPLDILFINQSGQIVSMLKSLSPCKQTNCPVYQSAQPASFMLEVNAGFIEQHRIQVGQQLKLPF